MKILVIRLKQIGDALISLPVCKSLRRTFPEAQIDYLVYEHIGPLFHNHPAVDNVLVITPAERRNKWKYLQKMRAIRQARYDMVIDLLTVPITALMTRFSGAKWQIGFDKGKWRSRLYKTAVPHPQSGGSLDAKLHILSGLPFAVQTVRDFDVVLAPHELEAMQRKMAAAGVPEDRPVLLFSPISRLGSKNWPNDYFKILADHCLGTHDASAVMIWGPGERPAVESLAATLQHKDRVFTTIETAGLRDLAALARNCAIFIGNDSGPRHVAEAVGIPTFTIFSPPISKYAWLPHRGETHRGVDMCDALRIDEQTWHKRVGEFQSDMARCYRKITPDIVIGVLDPMLHTLLPA